MPPPDILQAALAALRAGTVTHEQIVDWRTSLCMRALAHFTVALDAWCAAPTPKPEFPRMGELG